MSRDDLSDYPPNSSPQTPGRKWWHRWPWTASKTLPNDLETRLRRLEGQNRELRLEMETVSEKVYASLQRAHRLARGKSDAVDPGPSNGGDMPLRLPPSILKRRGQA